MGVQQTSKAPHSHWQLSHLTYFEYRSHSETPADVAKHRFSGIESITLPPVSTKLQPKSGQLGRCSRL